MITLWGKQCRLSYLSGLCLGHPTLKLSKWNSCDLPSSTCSSFSVRVVSNGVIDLPLLTLEVILAFHLFSTQLVYYQVLIRLLLQTPPLVSFLTVSCLCPCFNCHHLLIVPAYFLNPFKVFIILVPPEWFKDTYLVISYVLYIRKDTTPHVLNIPGKVLHNLAATYIWPLLGPFCHCGHVGLLRTYHAHSGLGASLRASLCAWDCLGPMFSFL